MDRRAFVLAAGSALAARPARAAKPTTAEKLAHVRTVGVISTIGDRFTLTFIGFTVFNNKKEQLPIEAWRIDERVKAQVAAELAGRFEFQPVEYNPAAFVLPEKPGFLSRPSAAKAAANVPDQGVDAFIVITPQWGAEHNYRGDWPIRGLGVLRAGYDMRFEPEDQLHAIHEVTVVDARTKATLAHAFGAIPGKTRWGQSPVRRLPLRTDRYDPARMTPHQEAELKVTTESLLDESLPFTFARMGLV